MSLPRRLWALRRERPLFVALSILTAGTLLVWPIVEFYLQQAGIGIGYGFNDFGAYTSALDRWVNGGSIYVKGPNGGYHGSYLYPPVTLLIFYPFATMGFYPGAIVMGAFSIVLLWLGLIAITRIFGYELRLWEKLAMLVAIFAFQPAIRDFRWAQISTFLTALLAFAFYFQERGESEESLYSDAELGERTRAAFKYGSGALTTLASVFKLFIATSGAHLLRDRKRFVGAVGTGILLLVASLAIFGIEAHQTYLDVLFWGKGWGDSRAPYLWDRYSAYRPLYVFGGLGLYLKAGVVLGTIALTLAARNVDTAAARRSTFALGLAVIPLAAPQADAHDLVLVLVPALILLAQELDRPEGHAWIPVLSVLLFHLHRYGFEVAINPPEWLPARTFVQENAPWFQPGMWATFILVWLAATRVAEHAEWPAVLQRARQRALAERSD